MKRNCYCHLWKKDPEVLKKQGIPEGYCGICERCGKFGHMSHYPGPVPYTGAWCDRCYRIVGWTWPFRIPLLWPVIILLGWVAYKLIRHFLHS
jgi:hypothetical protein